MKLVYKKPESLNDNMFHYCAGCGHGLIHRLIAEIVDELGMRENTIAVASVGCSVTAYDYFNFDMSESAHGRGPAVATGIKRVHPDKLVFTYQGDGDLAAIGTAEIIHAANRGELFTTIFVNNAIYGMTGGQMAPTTLPGMKTTTTPSGRGNGEFEGAPIRVCELLSSLEGVVYLERCMIADVADINRTKRAIKKAFQLQLAGKGFTLVEILSNCNVNWGMTPVDAIEYVKTTMTKYFPLGVVKEPKE